MILSSRARSLLLPCRSDDRLTAGDGDFGDDGRSGRSSGQFGSFWRDDRGSYDARCCVDGGNGGREDAGKVLTRDGERQGGLGAAGANLDLLLDLEDLDVRNSCNGKSVRVSRRGRRTSFVS